MEKRNTERRKVNQAVGAERRGKAADRRRCPECGSSIRSAREAAPGGSIERRYCTKCKWQATARQVDEAKLRALTSFEMTIHGAGKKAILDLDADFLKAAHLKVGDTLELKAVYSPGKKGIPLSWILAKAD
jgi:hypothetical protein